MTNIRPILLPLAIFLASLLLWGVSTIPDAALASMAQQAAHPWQDWGQATYHWETPLWLLLCGWVGATTVPTYTAFSAAVNVLAVLVACTLAWRAWGRLGALLVLVHPITYVLMTWIGLEDGLLVMCTAVLVWGRSPWAIGAAAAVAMATHPIGEVAGFGIVCLRLLADGRSPWDYLLPWAFGVLVACVGLLVLCPEVMATAGRFHQILARPALEWLTLSGTYLPLALYSFGFALWVPLVWAFRVGWSIRRPFYLVALVYFAGCLILTAFTLDTTRVFALLTWGPAMLVLQYSLDKDKWHLWPSWEYSRVIECVATFGILAPRLCVWAGQVAAVPFLSWIGGLR